MSQTFRRTEGRKRLSAARTALHESRQLLSAGQRVLAETQARLALERFRTAMDWYEDTDAFEPAHAELDRAGRFVRRTFGCHLHLEGFTYEQRCPVALGHNRIGFSVGMVINEAECSICGGPYDDCEHIAGQRYGRRRCVRVITKATPLEVSLVRRPSQPEARILRMGVSTSDLEAALGPSFVPGMPVSCDRCLSDCEGVIDPLEPAPTDALRSPS